MTRPFTIKIAVAFLLLDVFVDIAMFMNDALVNNFEYASFNYYENIPVALSIYFIWFGRKWIRNWYLAFLIIAISLTLYGHIDDGLSREHFGLTTIIYEIKGFGIHLLWLCLLYTDISENWFDEYTREATKQKMLKIEEKNINK